MMTTQRRNVTLLYVLLAVAMITVAMTSQEEDIARERLHEIVGDAKSSQVKSENSQKLLDGLNQDDLENAEQDAAIMKQVTRESAVKMTSFDDMAKRWKPSGVRVWGKRDEASRNSDGLLPKKWNQNGLRMWGKRDDGEDGRKKWSKNGMRMWGKRTSSGKLNKIPEIPCAESEFGSGDGLVKYSNLCRLSSVEDGEINLSPKQDSELASTFEDQTDVEKKWNSNKLRAWGKRVQNQYFTSDDAALQNSDELTKRSNEAAKKWTKDKLRVWGKRSVSAENSLQDPTSMSNSIIAGKLSPHKVLPIKGMSHIENPDSGISSSSSNHAEGGSGRQRRSWNDQDAWIHVKRSVGNPSNTRVNYYNLEDGPKRSWRTNVIRVWGKRG